MKPHCQALNTLLEKLGVARTFVGHTVRPEGASSTCERKVWRIDVGLSETESRAGALDTQVNLRANILKNESYFSSVSCQASQVIEVVNGGDPRVLTLNANKMPAWTKYH